VHWPTSKTVQTFANVAGNRILQITEGENKLVQKRYPTAAV